MTTVTITATIYPVLVGTIGSVNEDSTGVITIAANGNARFLQYRSLNEHYSLTGREDLGDDRCKIPLCVAQDITAFDIQRNTDYVRPDIATGLLRVADAYGRVNLGTAGDPTGYGNIYYECIVAGTTAATPPVYDPTVGNATVDGSATFVARDAWTRYATGQAIDDFVIQFDSLPDPRASDSTWYVMGGLFMRSNALSGFPKYMITTWDPATLQATLLLPVAMSDVPAGTKFEVHVGCDQTRDMCFARFNNIINLRAETFVPPPDYIFSF